MNANSLNLLRHFERADFADTEGPHTRPLVWATDLEQGDFGYMPLHRVMAARVPADDLHAMNDASIEDELSYGVIRETLLYSVVAVGAIAVSVLAPWQWF